jgi:argininosuccinate lyase
LRAVTLVGAAMEHATFDVRRMAARAREGWITVTELADTLTRDHDVPFKTSHAVAVRFVRAMMEIADPTPASAAELLREITESVVGRAIGYDNDRLGEILSPEYFVRVRTTPGGPAPAETARAIEASLEKLAADDQWINDTLARLRAAESKLAQKSAQL